MVDILTGTAFDAPRRMHHAEDGVTLEFPSGEGSRAMGLLGLRAINWRALGGRGMQTFTAPRYIQYSTDVAAWINSLGISGNGIVVATDTKATNRQYHFVMANVSNGAVKESCGYVRISTTGTVLEGKVYGSNNDARLEAGAVVAFVPLTVDW